MKKLLLLIIISASFSYSFGQAGGFDPGFGNLGIVRTDFPTNDIIYDNNAQQVLLHPDGSFYLVFEMNRQSFVVHRFASGAIDPGYGQGGYSVPVYMRNPRAVLQPDGKIVIGGTTLHNNNEDFELARLLSNGTPDLSFGGDGKVSTDFSSGRDDLFDLALQSDGKIIAVGRTTSSNSMALARYNSDGSPDLSFSIDGKQTTSFLNGQSASSVAIQNDGKLIVAGNNNVGGITSMLVVRFLPDGTIDNSFSDDGYQTITSGWLSGASSVAIQNDGKIIAGGFSLNNLNIMRFTLARLNTDGSMDNSFSGDGKEITDFGGNDAEIFSILIQNDGRILAAGFTSPGGSLSRDFAVARYNSDGTPDLSFSGDGLATPGVTAGGSFPFAEARDMALLPDGRILLAGSASHGTVYAAVRLLTNGSLDISFDADGILRDHMVAGKTIYNASAVQPDGKILTAGSGPPIGNEMNMVVARYLMDGSLDISFSDDGKLTIDFFSNSDEAFALAIQPDGKIVVAGSASNGSNSDFAIIRLNTDGSIDNSFSFDGKVMTDFSGGDDVATGIVVQPDGRIVVGGYAMMGPDNFNFALARYFPDGSPDASFSGDGILTSDFGGSRDLAFSLLLQPDGKLVLAGESGPTAPSPIIHSNVSLARYTPQGQLDPSFDSDGKQTTDIAGGNDRATSAVLQSDGKIVLGVNTNGDFAFLRYNSNGSPDNSFSGDGKLAMDLGNRNGFINSVVLQANGKIIGGGTVTAGFESDLLLVRINSDGTPDAGFSGDGIITYDLGYGTDLIQGMSLSGNRLYAAGATAYGGQVGLLAAFLLDCTINASIPDAKTLTKGVDANTVYTGYLPASDLTLSVIPSGGTGPYSYLWSNGATTATVTVYPTTNTTFSVTVTDASGCLATTNKVVTVMNIRCGNKGDKVVVCKVPPGNPANAGSICISPDAVPAHLNNGGYLGNCKSGMLTKNGNPSILEEEKFTLDISPNPGNTKFGLHFRSDDAASGDLVIMDILGRVIERRKVIPNQLLELGAAYAPGTYIAELNQGNRKLQIKFVKR